MKTILIALRNSILCFSAKRALLEGFIKYDFKFGDTRESLMQVCFSSFGSVFFFLLLAVVGIDPFKSSWSLSQWLAPDNSFLLFLLDGRTGVMISVFFVGFVMEWLLRREAFLILFAAFLLNRFELHVNLALMFVMSVLFSRICYFWWAVKNLKSESRHIWNRLHQIQALVWIILFISSLSALHFFQVSYLFQQSGLWTRFYFLVLVLFLYFALLQGMLSLWGHFYFHRKAEPSDLFVRYSTSQFILRFKLLKGFLVPLRTFVESQIEKHQKSIFEYSELEKVRPGLKNTPVRQTLDEELGFLKEALARLERIG